MSQKYMTGFLSHKKEIILVDCNNFQNYFASLNVLMTIWRQKHSMNDPSKKVTEMSWVLAFVVKKKQIALLNSMKPILLHKYRKNIAKQMIEVQFLFGLFSDGCKNFKSVGSWKFNNNLADLQKQMRMGKEFLTILSEILADQCAQQNKV